MKEQNIAYQMTPCNFDTNFPHYIQKRKIHKRVHSPAATAAPGNNADAGGAISKPLILLLQVDTVSI
jgi:hypothetical protein